MIKLVILVNFLRVIMVKLFLFKLLTHHIIPHPVAQPCVRESGVLPPTSTPTTNTNALISPLVDEVFSPLG